MVSFTALGGVALALVLSIVDFGTEGIFSRRIKLKEKWVSFAAGMSVTYIFLELFPRLYGTTNNKIIPPFILIGFIGYHLIEKYVYQHAPRDEVVKEIEYEHAWSLFAYHFVIGLALVSIAVENFMDSVLLFIPVFLHTTIDALPRTPTFKQEKFKLFFSSGSILGALLGFTIPTPKAIQLIILGLVAGLLIFFETRELIPKKRAGKPSWFLVGALLFLIISLFLRST